MASEILRNERELRPMANLRHALREIVVHPLRTLVPPWSWKAAAFAAAVRGVAFFITNLKAGQRAAGKALVVEAVFAFIAGGLIGAISQQLRKAEPLWATACLVWLALPGIMLFAQLEVHSLAHTPYLTGGLVLSFCLAAVSAAFSWYAMRQGAMLGGSDETTIRHDLQVLPSILFSFLVAVPALVIGTLRKKHPETKPDQ